MLKSWYLKNFKSVREGAELKLAPLTILAGPNSSGKSTLIQSILLVRQTLTSQVLGRPIVLNGPSVRLGGMQDVRSFKGGENIVVSWSTEADSAYHAGWGGFPQLGSLTCEVSFGASRNERKPRAQAPPELEYTKLRVRSAIPPNEEIQISVERLSSDESNRRHVEMADFHRLPRPPEDFRIPTSYFWNYGVKLDGPEGTVPRDSEYQQIVGCVLHHFVPEVLLARINRVRAISALLSTKLETTQRQLNAWLSSQDIAMHLSVGSQAIEFLRGQLEEDDQRALGIAAGMIPIGVAVPLYAMQSRIAHRNISDNVALVEKIASLKEPLEAALSAEGDVNQLISVPMPPLIQAATRYLQYSFPATLRYLGPLRIEPQPVHALGSQTDPKDIGLRGEYTAAVYHLFENTRVSVILPSTYISNEASSTVVMTLKSATEMWLRHLGLAERVHASEKGTLGHGLKVTTEGVNHFHDLTHVGVGVSQVFPILVMCLLAEIGDTLILEQPELHLHPRVQALLADFLLSIAQSGRQCVVETHSEYLINRIRLRAAQSNDDSINNITKIYFVEKSDGVSNFRAVKFNRFGAITDWPSGFFDQSQIEAEDILRAALYKRGQT